MLLYENENFKLLFPSRNYIVNLLAENFTFLKTLLFVMKLQPKINKTGP